MAYCIYTGASVMVQDVKAGELDAEGRMNTFIRALKGGLTTCPIVQRSIDIIKNALHSGHSKPMKLHEIGPDSLMRRYLPAFPYGDAQMNTSNETAHSFVDLDAFALLDSFPENHIHAATGEWGLPQ